MSASAVQTSHYFYYFGPFRLGTRERFLLWQGMIVPLSPKAFDTLAMLVAHNGQLLEKDRLLTHLWPQTEVEENNLVQIISALRKAVALAGDDPLMIATLGCMHAIRGQGAEARQTLAELRELSGRRYVSPYHFALIHADLGERTQAFEWFERAFEDRASNLIWAGTDPKLDGLRADSLQDKNRQVASAQCFRGGIPNLPLAQYLVGTGALMMSTASRLFEKYAKTTVFLEAL